MEKLKLNKNFFSKKIICNKIIKEEKAITLISLVVTIIVLLILAGVAIATLTGENGLINKASNAKLKTQRAQIIEQARIDIFDKQSMNKKSEISMEQLKEVLNKYFENVPEDIDITKVDTIMLNSNKKYGEIQNIALSEIYNGKILISGNQIQEQIKIKCSNGKNIKLSMYENKSEISTTVTAPIGYTIIYRYDNPTRGKSDASIKGHEEKSIEGMNKGNLFFITDTLETVFKLEKPATSPYEVSLQIVEIRDKEGNPVEIEE